MDFEKSQATLELEAKVEPMVQQLLHEDLEPWQQIKLKEDIFISLRDGFLYQYTEKNLIEDRLYRSQKVQRDSEEKPWEAKKEQWDSIAAMEALQYAMEQCRKGARNENTGELYTFVASFKYKYNLLFKGEQAEKMKEKSGREGSEHCLQMLKDFFRLLMKARGWDNEQIRKCLGVNLLSRKKTDDLLEKLGASEKEKQKVYDIFDKMLRNASLDAQIEGSDGESIPMVDVYMYEDYRQEEGARFSADQLVIIVDKAMEIAAERKRGNSEQLLRYWVTLKIFSGELAVETVQALQQYEDPALRDYLQACPKGMGKMALREALALYMHKAPETVRKDLEVSAVNSSSKVQKLLEQAYLALREGGVWH